MAVPTKLEFLITATGAGKTVGDLLAIKQALDNTAKNANSITRLASAFGVTYKQAERLAKSIGLSTDEIEEAVAALRQLNAVKADTATKMAVLTARFGTTADQFERLQRVARNLDKGLGAATGKARGLFEGIAGTAFAFNNALQAVQAFAAAGQQAFDLLIGQNAALQDQILGTQTSLASTNRVIVDGVEISDPTAAIQALEGPVNEALEKIRIESLKLSGVTSAQLVPVFQIVAGQAGAIGANLDQAADLALDFSAALGTFNIPLEQSAQEINSILTGQIGPDSALAQRLGITNDQIKRWQQAGTVLENLRKALEPARAGNALNAEGFSGVTSNIQEIFETVTRVAGEPLFDALTDQLQQILTVLQENQPAIEAFAQAFINRFIEVAQAVGEVAAQLADIFLPVLQALGSVGVAAADLLVDAFLEVVRSISQLLKFVGPALTQLLDLAAKSIKFVSENAEILNTVLAAMGIRVNLSKPFQESADGADEFSDALGENASNLQLVSRNSQQATRRIAELNKEIEKSSQASATDEAQALAEIAQLQESGAISKEEAEQRKLNASQSRIDAELNAERNRLDQLTALGQQENADQEKQRLEAIQQTNLKIAQLEKQASEQRIQNSEREAQRRIDAELSRTRRPLESQSADLSAESNELQRQNQLLNEQAENQERLNQLQQQRLEFAIDETRQRQEQLSRQGRDDEALALEAQIANQQRELFQLQLEALNQQAEARLRGLEISERQRDIELEQQRIQAEIATLEANANLQKARATGASAEEIANLQQQVSLRQQQLDLVRAAQSEQGQINSLNREQAQLENQIAAERLLQEQRRAARQQEEESRQRQIELVDKQIDRVRLLADTQTKALEQQNAAIQRQSQLLSAANDLAQAATNLEQQRLQFRLQRAQAQGNQAQAERIQQQIFESQNRALQQQFQFKLLQLDISNRIRESELRREQIAARIAELEARANLQKAISEGRSKEEVQALAEQLNLARERTALTQQAITDQQQLAALTRQQADLEFTAQRESLTRQQASEAINPNLRRQLERQAEREAAQETPAINAFAQQAETTTQELSLLDQQSAALALTIGLLERRAEQAAENLGSIPRLQARRDGGPVVPGQPYLVGEAGPELIIPRAYGNVLTAQQTAQVLRPSYPHHTPPIHPSTPNTAVLQEIKALRADLKSQKLQQNNSFTLINETDPYGKVSQLHADLLRNQIRRSGR